MFNLRPQSPPSPFRGTLVVGDATNCQFAPGPAIFGIPFHPALEHSVFFPSRTCGIQVATIKFLEVIMSRMFADPLLRNSRSGWISFVLCNEAQQLHAGLKRQWRLFHSLFGMVNCLFKLSPHGVEVSSGLAEHAEASARFQSAQFAFCLDPATHAGEEWNCADKKLGSIAESL